MEPTRFEAGPAAFAVALLAAQRRLSIAEARLAGLMRAQVSAESVLRYARDPEMQRAFEAAFAAGRAILDGHAAAGVCRGIGPDEDQDDDAPLG